MNAILLILVSCKSSHRYLLSEMIERSGDGVPLFPSKIEKYGKCGNVIIIHTIPFNISPNEAIYNAKLVAMMTGFCFERTINARHGQRQQTAYERKIIFDAIKLNRSSIISY